MNIRITRQHTTFSSIRAGYLHIDKAYETESGTIIVPKGIKDNEVVFVRFSSLSNKMEIFYFSLNMELVVRPVEIEIEVKVNAS